MISPFGDMELIKILHIVGARPNFMKAAPVIRALGSWSNIYQIIIHTGQHYDPEMSEIFFKQLDIPEPDINLEVGSGSHSVQTAEIMVRLEQVLIREKPDLVIVYGDVNSTLAGALVCAKLLVPLAHVEAGLRSFDRTMPEEINRLVTDQLAELLFTHSPEAEQNLLREGISPQKIHYVGNVMIDTLVNLLPFAKERWDNLSSIFNIDVHNYALVTLHRPSNVDKGSSLKAIMDTLNEISNLVKVIFPVHPRTRKNLERNGLNLDQNSSFRLIDPLGYLDFLALQCQASFVITDSGGIQEETSYLNIPCLTLRENTERPITITMGTNVLVGQDMELLKKKVREILSGDWKQSKTIPFWDGQASQRIAQTIKSSLG